MFFCFVGVGVFFRGGEGGGGGLGFVVGFFVLLRKSTGTNRCFRHIWPEYTCRLPWPAVDMKTSPCFFSLYEHWMTREEAISWSDVTTDIAAIHTQLLMSFCFIFLGLALVQSGSISGVPYVGFWGRGNVFNVMPYFRCTNCICHSFRFYHSIQLCFKHQLDGFVLPCCILQYSFSPVPVPKIWTFYFLICFCAFPF